MKSCKITVDLYNTFRERMPEYVQYDRNVPLEITVLEHGKPADLNGLFGRLLVSKPDGHEVYSNDVEINGNIITTILGEQVFTASGVAQITVDLLGDQNSKRALIPFGMRIKSAVITDESIKSSNDYQTITALISDVRALDAMFHVEQEQRAEAFNAQMQSQEATFTEAQRQFLADHREAMFHVEQQMTEQAGMFHVEQTKRAKAFEQSEADREQRFEAQTTEWAQTVEQAEATRQFNEERRQSAENKRESAEKARESAERQRVDTEAVRQRQEQERGQGEAGRATAEANRVKAEQVRVDNESSRKSAESSRVNAESQRATAESHRVTAETSRANAESQRATAETNRAGAEGRRSEAESNRVTAENNRATAESNRVTAENARETQENARREAEEDRATRMAQWEAKAEETAQKAQEAVDSAQAFVNTNEAKLLGPNDKKDYMGNSHESVKEAMDSNVEYVLGEVNTVNYEGQHITATDTIEKQVKSAILKGCTLVNLSNPTNEVWRSNAINAMSKHFNIINTVVGDKYTILIFDYSEKVKKFRLSEDNGVNRQFEPQSIKPLAFNCTINNNKMYLYLYADDGVELTTDDVENVKMVILKGDFTNQDIPYFEGMQSVKMPVLTTRNNLNLLDTNPNSWISTTNAVESKHNIVVTPNKVYSFHNVKGAWVDIVAYNDNGDEISKIVSISGAIGTTKTVFTTPNDCASLKVILKLTTNTTEPNRHKLRLFEGETDLGYPPYSEVYKSNILTVNEEVELRGIGDVQDTLDCLTGELVNNYGIITIDGDFVTSTTSIVIPDAIVEWTGNDSHIKADNLPTRIYTGSDSVTTLTLALHGGRVYFRGFTGTLDELKSHFNTTPTRFQYRLAKKSIKTVDLSDNHVYSYKDVTHYDCSSAEGSLVPTLSIDVPTNLPAVVTRQRATIQELEKENQELTHAVTIVDEHREEGDLELLSSDFDFELRLMEIEFAIGVPMMSNYKGVRNMARTPYDMAKALILGGKYEREEMITKLDRFEKLGSITADQKAELIALMDAVDLTR